VSEESKRITEAVAWFNKGVAFVDMGKFKEALDCFDKALKLQPNNKHAWLGKGHALERLGKNGEANICFKKAEELRQKTPDPK